MPSKTSKSRPREDIPASDGGVTKKRGRGRPPKDGSTPRPDGERKKKKPEAKHQYAREINRVRKQVHSDLTMSKKAMSILHSMCVDMFERIAFEAAKLKRRSGRLELNSRDVQTAVRLLLPGELAKHAVSEGTKAVHKYMASRGKAGGAE